MSRHVVSESLAIAAPAASVYATIADYRVGHPAILPKPPFVDLVVEEGGVGAGTRIRFRMHVLGATHTLRATITEPDPGRVLVETNDNGTVTTFTVEPRRGGTECDVTISTAFPERGGMRAAVERWVSMRMLPSLYRRELAQLAARARGHTADALRNDERRA